MHIIITSLVIVVLLGSSGAGPFKCPDGYISTHYGSCEPSRRSCGPGHYYALDQCKPCPCNNHEKSCEIDKCSRVRCNCRAGYTGKYCQNHGSDQIKLKKPLQVVVEPATQTVYRNFDDINVSCIVNDTDAQVMWLRNGQVYTDQHGQQVGRTFRIDKARESDGGTYICLAIKGGKAFKAVASIKVVEATAPVVKITPITDGKMKVPLGERVELTCNADGFASYVNWQRISSETGVQEIIQSSVTSEVHYQFMSMSEKQAGEYICYAQGPIGSDAKSIHVEIEPLVLKVYPEESQVVISGQSVALECRKPAAYSNVDVHWTREDGRPLESNVYQSVNGSLMINNIRIEDEGRYNCSVTKGSLSASAIAEIKVETLPVVEIPQSNDEEIRVGIGEKKNLTCNASGHPPPNVQWQKFSGKTNSYESIQQAVPNSAVYEYNSLSENGESLYRCLANNSAGSSTETVRIVSIEPVLEVLPGKFPVVTEGNSITLECRETAGYSNFNIYWRRKNAEGKWFPLASNFKTANGSLMITNISRNQAGEYQCVGSNGAIAITELVQIEINTLPVIQIPQSVGGNITAKLGDKVTLTCNANGHPQPIVQWQTSKFPSTSMSYQITNRATPKSVVYEIESLSEDKAGLYVCMANNLAGSSEKSVEVKIKPPVLEVQSNVSDAVMSGSSVTLHCSESAGYSDMKIDWAREDNKPLGPNVVKSANGSLTIFNIGMSEEGRYKCSATNKVASSSVTTEIKVKTLPIVEITPSNDGSITAKLGDKVTLTCNVDGHPQPDVQWQKFSNKTKSYEAARKATSKSLVYEITALSENEAGLYLCLANNSAGSSNKTAQVVIKPPVLEVHSNVSDAVISGSSVTLACRESAGYSNIEIHWAREDGRPFAPNVVQSTDGSLKITDITIDDKGSYKCSVTIEGVSTSATREIEVQSLSTTEIPSTTIRNIIVPPKTPSDEFISSSESGGEFAFKQTIKVSPKELKINVNERSKIVCELESLIKQTTIHLIWRRADKLPISTKFITNDGILTIQAPTKKDSGEYICVALDAEGTELFSASSALKVINPPDIWLQFKRDFVIGDNVTLTCTDYRKTGPTYSWLELQRSLLSNEEVQDNVLTIRGFKKENVGNFCCSGKNADGRNTHCRAVKPKAVEIIKLSTSHLEVVVGGSVEEDCSIVDEDGQKIHLHWERSNNSLSSNVITEKDGHLTLSKVTKMDSGDYVCRGVSVTGQELARKTLTLIVIAPPETIEITTEDVSDDNDVTMTCKATGDNLSYEWTAEEGNLLPNENDWTRTLYIQGVGKANDRTFCCKAYNIAGHLEKCKQLPTLLVISKPESTILADSPFEIDCQVLGMNASKIHPQWQRANSAEFSEKTIIEHGLLKISNVMETDAGDYNCLGLDEDGTEHFRRTTSLHVLSLPKAVFKTDDANFKVGGTLSATCTATGSEIRTLELETDDKVLLPNEKIEGPVLTVSDLPKNFDRKYWCTATNDIGTSRVYLAPRFKKIENK